VSPSALMFGSTIALFSAFVMLVVLPPGPGPAMAVCAAMLATIVMGTMLLSMRGGNDGVPSARLTGRSTFSTQF
jgi:hypothetical protein